VRYGALAPTCRAGPWSLGRGVCSLVIAFQVDQLEGRLGVKVHVQVEYVSDVIKLPVLLLSSTGAGGFKLLL
jgi:hypothetical protein